MSVYQLAARLSGMKTIHVSDEVWEALFKLRVETRARSMDEVLRRILSQLALLPPGQQTSSPTGQMTNLPHGQNTLSADQVGKVPSGQNTEVSTSQVGKVPSEQSTKGSAPRRHSPLDSVEDLVLVRNVRDPDRLAQAAEERGLLVYSLAGMGLPRTYIVMTQRYRDFVVSVAEGDRTPPSEVEDALTGVLRDKPRELNSGEKYAIALAALRTAGELVYTENGGWRPAKPGSQA
jgi:hypothetical protein